MDENKSKIIEYQFDDIIIICEKLNKLENAKNLIYDKIILDYIEVMQNILRKVLYEIAIKFYF